jgi:hypothetical protein
VREARFLSLQIFCFRQTARGFSVTLDSFSKGSLSRCVVASLSLSPCGLAFVFLWASAFADWLFWAVAPAFLTAPFAGFSMTCETHWPENHTAPVTDRLGESTVFFEKIAALLNGQAHSTSKQMAVA